MYDREDDNDEAELDNDVDEIDCVKSGDKIKIWGEIEFGTKAVGDEDGEDEDDNEETLNFEPSGDVRLLFWSFKKLLFKSDFVFCLLRTIRLILETEGALSCVQIPSLINFSLISQANIFGFFCLYVVIDSITDEVATFGLEPPINPGLIEPVELYLYQYVSIF